MRVFRFYVWRGIKVGMTDMMQKYAKPERFARHWLLLLGVLVYAIILVGGATRLTDSGLSITEWAPIKGAIPPLSAASWQSEFDLYKQTAEYQSVNQGMSLSEFRFIYWWEWGHRQLGRIIGLVAFVGLILLAFVYRAKRHIVWPAFVITALVGVQGGIGWWMVASGIGETTRVDVAPYRLATHFSLALVILCLIAWTFWSLPRANPALGLTKIYRRTGGIVLLFALVFIQMTSGALVAGLDAGRTYTDWPLMAGEFLPSQYADEGLGWRAFFEGRATTQFNHRMLAYILYAWAGLLAVLYRRRMGWICFAVLSVQVVWGIYTLVSAAPIKLALGHQGLGVIAMLTCLYWVRFSRRHKVY